MYMTNSMSTMAYILVCGINRDLYLYSFEQALIKESICNAQLYIHIVQHLSDKTNHNESFRERPRYFKDVSYLAGGFERTWKDRLPYIENNAISSANVVWSRGESFGRGQKKKNTTPSPSPLNYIKKLNNESKEEVSYWSAAQSQNSV